MAVEIYANGAVDVIFPSRDESYGVTKIINMLHNGKIVKVNNPGPNSTEEKDIYHWRKFGLHSREDIKTALNETPFFMAHREWKSATMEIVPDDIPGGIGEDFDKWLEYYITELVVPNDGVANGDVFWETSEGSKGVVCIVNNKISHKTGETVYVSETNESPQGRKAERMIKATISISRLGEILPTMNAKTIYAEAGSTQHGRVDWVDVWAEGGYMKYRVLTMDMDDRYADDALLMVSNVLNADPRVKMTGLDLSQICSQAQPNRLMSGMKIGE